MSATDRRVEVEIHDVIRDRAHVRDRLHLAACQGRGVVGRYVRHAKPDDARTGCGACETPPALARRLFECLAAHAGLVDVVWDERTGPGRVAPV